MSMLSRPWVRPVLVVAIIIAWFGIGGVGGPTVGRLADVQENDAGAFLPSNAESSLAAEAHARFVSSDAVPALFVVDNITGPADINHVNEFTETVVDLALEGDPRGRTVRESLTEDPRVLVADSGEAALIVFNVDADAFAENVGEEAFANIFANTVKAAWDESGATTDGYLSGAVGLVADLVAAFAGIDGVLLVVALIVVLVILLAVYRSPVLPFLVLFTALSALSGAVVVVYALALNDVLVLNGQSQGIMFILVVGATTDYALLLVARYREELRRHESPYRAMAIAWRRSLEPIAASAVTVILGLLCLLFSDLASNASLGPVAAIGIVGAFFAAMTLLPALLLTGGKRARGVFWPALPDYRGPDGGDDELLAVVEARFGLWGRISRSVGEHPRRTWIAAAVSLGALAAFLPSFEDSGTGEQDVFLTEVDSVLGFEVIEAHFAAGQASPVRVIVEEADADAAMAVVSDVPGVDTAYLLTASVREGAPPGVVLGEPPVVVEGLVEINAITRVAASSQEAPEVVQDIRDALRAVAPSSIVGGRAAESLDTQLTAASDLRVIIPSVLAVIFVVLVFLLRSFAAPAVLILANLLSFGASLGLAAIFFNHVFDFPGSDPTTVLFGFVFLVALGVDYSIFLMSRAREESLKHGTREGVRRSLAVTGGVITSAGIVLAATFAALGVLPLIFLFQLAFIVATGVLIDTFVVRTLLVPGLIHELGSKAWWPWRAAMRD
jgi:RND superfamily putative drug exporter